MRGVVAIGLASALGLVACAPSAQRTVNQEIEAAAPIAIRYDERAFALEADPRVPVVSRAAIRLAYLRDKVAVSSGSAPVGNTTGTTGPFMVNWPSTVPSSLTILPPPPPPPPPDSDAP
ncbi:MAG TPA: hypothetical protein VF316_03400 [Polyangiaceae bacterium]